MGNAKIPVPMMDYDGMTMFHCHILEHEDIVMFEDVLYHGYDVIVLSGI